MRNIIFQKYPLGTNKSIDFNGDNLVLKKSYFWGLKNISDSIKVSDIDSIRIEYRKRTVPPGPHHMGGRSYLWCIITIQSNGKQIYFDIKENNAYKQTIGPIIIASLQTTMIKNKTEYDPIIREAKK